MNAGRSPLRFRAGRFQQLDFAAFNIRGVTQTSVISAENAPQLGNPRIITYLEYHAVTFIHVLQVREALIRVLDHGAENWPATPT